MIVPVPVESSEIIKAYILCLNPVLKLKKREVEVLDAMLKVYFNLKKASKQGQIKLEEIDGRINDPVGRKVIRDLIGMSGESYNNHILQLKKKKVITKDNKLVDFLKNIDSSNNTLKVTYEIKLNKPNTITQLKPIKETTNIKLSA